MEKERDWFRLEALQLDKMNKDHKRLIVELRQRLEAVSEDKDCLHKQLIVAKSTNRNAMFELEQSKKIQGGGEQSGSDWQALMGGHMPSSPGIISGEDALGSKIFDPTALPDNHHETRNNGELNSKDTSMIISGLDGAAIKQAA